MFEFGSYGFIAERDLRSAKKNYGIEEYNVVGVYCQQCLEKIAKHYLQLTRVGEDVIRIMRSHKLYALYREIDDARVQEELGKVLGLTDCYYDTRYPGESYFILTQQPAKEFLDATERMFKVMCELIEMIPTNEF